MNYIITQLLKEHGHCASSVQGQGRKADDVVPAPRKLHPSGAAGPMSFTGMTGLKAVRVAVAETDETGVYRDIPGCCGDGVRPAGGSEERLEAAHWPGRVMEA